MNRSKRLRRMSGFLRARLPELQLGRVLDPRARRGRRYKLEALLRHVLLGMMAGCKGLGELEQRDAWASHDVRRLLGLPEGVADTTLRDVLCRLDWRSIREALHRTIRKAQRRKALTPQGLPFHMVALDGKVTALPNGEGPYAQWQTPENGAPYALMRTTTATLVTAAGKPCIDVMPIPASTNEMGHFKTAFGELVRTYGDLVKLVSYDAGASCEENARAVRAAGKHFLFRLNNPEWRLHQIATELLTHAELAHESIETRSNKVQVRRRLKMFRVNQGKLPKLARKSEIWADARLLLQVETETFEGGVCQSRETKLYITSLPAEELTAEQWLFATVKHWGVETTHQVLDTAFQEDERPWIEADANGMLIVLVLRRIAYTLLTLFRSVTLRASENRLRPWCEFIDWVDKTLTVTTAKMLAGLRALENIAASVG